MRYAFTKMHGLGNDFVVLDARDTPLELSPARIQWLADRRYGIGCDQVLVLEPANDEAAVAGFRVFNADGGEVEQCGNGMRCLGLYLFQAGEVPSGSFQLTGRAGKVLIEVIGPQAIHVNLDAPNFAPDKIPFLADHAAPFYVIEVDGRTVELGAVSMGNPHAVLTVDEAASADVARLGSLIGGHTRFPQGANVGFMEIVDRQQIKLRVYERGAAETLACGSGACAAAVVGIQRGLLDNCVKVALPGGELVVQWNGAGESVWMCGPATLVFQGEIEQ